MGAVRKIPIFFGVMSMDRRGGGPGHLFALGLHGLPGTRIPARLSDRLRAAAGHRLPHRVRDGLRGAAGDPIPARLGDRRLREHRYTVARPVMETSEREEHYTVMPAGLRDADARCSYNVIRYVQETAEREEHYVVNRPVMGNGRARRVLHVHAAGRGDGLSHRVSHGHAAGDHRSRRSTSTRAASWTRW